MLADLADLAKVLNGQWWEHGVLIHYCSGSDCCANRFVTEQRVVQVIQRCVLRSAPMVPSCSKWTKLGGTLDFLSLGFWVHNVFHTIHSLGLGKLVYSVEAAATDGLDPSLAHDLSFSAVEGSRYHRCKQFLASADNNMKMRIVIIALEVSGGLGSADFGEWWCVSWDNLLFSWNTQFAQQIANRTCQDIWWRHNFLTFYPRFFLKVALAQWPALPA